MNEEHQKMLCSFRWKNRHTNLNSISYLTTIHLFGILIFPKCVERPNFVNEPCELKGSAKERFEWDLDSQLPATSYQLLQYKYSVVKPTFKDVSNDVLVHLLKKWFAVQGSWDSIWYRWKSLKLVMLRMRRK